VLEEGTVLPIGAAKEISVNVRVLAASNRPIQRAIRDERLREDLYFRLKVFCVHLPPLRERIDDLPDLTEHFIRKSNEKHGRHVTSVDDGFLSVLASYWWPGNIRELKHAIERAVIVCESAMLTANDLPPEINATAGPASSFTVRLGSSMRDVVDELIWRTIALWVDGSGWKPVDEILARDGYQVSVVQEPLTSLKDDVAATRRILDLQPGPCILVAHSYGGTVITEAGTDPHVIALVFIAAHEPDAGETEASNGNRLPSATSKTKAIEKTPDGYTHLDPAVFPNAFAADLPPEQVRGTLPDVDGGGRVHHPRQ
jgi:hypothetical protein